MTEPHLHIRDDGSLHKYRTEIPNTVVRGLKSRELSLAAKWLYVYLKSVTGDDGECFRSTTTIAAESGISRGQVSAAKKELVSHGLITVKSGKNPRREPDHIRIKDIWLTNMQEFSVHIVNTDDDTQMQENQATEGPSVHVVNTESVQCSYSEHQCSYSEHQCSCGEHKKIPLRRSHEELEENSLPTGESWHDGVSETHTSLPSLPSGVEALPPKKPKKPLVPLRDDDWLRAVLLDYTLLDFQALNDDAWWIDVSQALAGVFTQAWLNAECGKISAYLRENPRKTPASPHGWKRFIRSWLHRSYELQRRYSAHAPTHRQHPGRY